MRRESRRSPKRAEFLERLSRQVADSERQEFLDALTRMATEPRRAVRLNRLDADIERFVADEFERAGLLLGDPVPWEPWGRFASFEAVKALGAHPLIGSGSVYMQEPGAMEAVAVLDPQPGEGVLDLCAAPGSKSGQIGERLGGRGWLVAADPDRSRAERLTWLLARQGVPNVSVYAAEPARLATVLGHATFDAVLVDAPCSGESFFAKRRDSRGDVSDREVERCAARQKSILEVTAELTRPGGRIVYSTCTYSREENEDVVESFVAAHPEFRLTRAERRWPHKDGVAGGFVARLDRKGSEAATFEPSRLEFGSALLRHGPWRWDREIEPYALVLLRGDRHALRAFAKAQGLELGAELEALEVGDAEAKAYLQGQALAESPSAQGLVAIKWRGRALGPAKAVPGRVNNLLPKALRC